MEKKSGSLNDLKSLFQDEKPVVVSARMKSGIISDSDSLTTLLSNKLRTSKVVKNDIKNTENGVLMELQFLDSSKFSVEITKITQGK